MAVGKLTVYAPTRPAGKRFELLGQTLTSKTVATAAPAIGAWGWLTPDALAGVLADAGRSRQYIRCGVPAVTAAREKFVSLPADEARDVGRHRNVRGWLGLPNEAQVISATRDFLDWAPGGQWVLIDFDAKHAPRRLDAHELAKLLQEHLPGLAGAPMVIAASSSTYIRNTATGTQLLGAGGWHCWVLLEDGGKSREFINAAHRVLVAKGCGWVVVSEAGEPMVKSPVDPAMAGPVQPAFLAAVTVAPLAQERPAPIVIRADAPALAAQAVIDLAMQLSREFEQAVLALTTTDEVRKQVEQVLAERRARRAPIPQALGTRRTAGVGSGREVPWYDFSNPADAIHLDAGHWGSSGWRTVAEVLADASRYDGATCADPLEPGYGAGPGQVARNKAKLMLSRADPICWSQAHGGRAYRLQSPDGLLAGVQVEIVEAADPKIDFEAAQNGLQRAGEASEVSEVQPGRRELVEAPPGEPLPAYPAGSVEAMLRQWGEGSMARHAMLGLTAEGLIDYLAAGGRDRVQIAVESDERADQLGRRAMDAGLRVRVLRGRKGAHWLRGTQLCKKPRVVTTLDKELGEVTMSRLICRSRQGGACPHIDWCNRSGYRRQFRETFGGGVEAELRGAPAQVVITTIASLTAPSPGDIERERPAIVIVEASAGLSMLRRTPVTSWTEDEVSELPGAAEVIRWLEAGADPASRPEAAIMQVRTAARSWAEGDVLPPMADGLATQAAKEVLRANLPAVRASVLAKTLDVASEPDAAARMLQQEGRISVIAQPPLERLQDVVLLAVTGYEPAPGQLVSLAAPDRPSDPWVTTSALAPLYVTQATDGAFTVEWSIRAARRLGGLVAALAVAAPDEQMAVLADTRIAKAIRDDIEAAQLPQGVLEVLAAVVWMHPGPSAARPARQGGRMLVIGAWTTSTDLLAFESGIDQATGQAVAEAGEPVAVERTHVAPDGRRFVSTVMVRNPALERAATYRFQHAVQLALAATGADLVVVLEGREFDTRLCVGGRWDPVESAALIAPRAARAYDLAVAIVACGGLDKVTSSSEAVDALVATGQWDGISRDNIWRDLAQIAERASRLRFATRRSEAPK